jgi:hypothetical protein
LIPTFWKPLWHSHCVPLSGGTRASNFHIGWNSMSSFRIQTCVVQIYLVVQRHPPLETRVPTFDGWTPYVFFLCFSCRAVPCRTSVSVARSYSVFSLAFALGCALLGGLWSLWSCLGLSVTWTRLGLTRLVAELLAKNWGM